MKVQNKGNKGNPNHDEEGKFTTADNTGTVKETDKSDDILNTSEVVEPGNNLDTNDDDLDVIALDFDLDDIDSFLDSIDTTIAEDNAKKAQEIINSISNTKYVNKVFYDNLHIEEKKELLLNSTQEYDKTKLENLSEDEINALIYAESVLNHKRKIEQKIALLEKERSALNNSQIEKNSELRKQFYPNGNDTLSEIWILPIDSSLYLEKKQAVDENGLNAIDRKRLYYEDIIKDPLSLEDDIVKAQDNLNRLNEYVDITEKYLIEKEKINQDIGVKLADLEATINEQRSNLKTINEDSNYLKTVKISQEFIAKYQDKMAPYSQLRKDNAIWFKTDEEGSAQTKATKYFGSIFESMWNNMSSGERSRLVEYTGAFSKFNRPLRGLSHEGWGGFNFAEAVTDLTNAIDKCIWKDDIWVQRGISDSKIFMLPGTSDLRSLGSMSNEQLQSLVGTLFTDNGFYSAGAGKGTGFNGQVILNTYCPKGTKMAYMNTKGHYAHSGENEMILQRGYSYRITKVEKKNEKTYIDCEVVLGSDNNKVVDMNELTAMGKKYLK